MVEFANLRPRFEEHAGPAADETFDEEDTQLSETDLKRLDAARDAFRSLGAQLRAFAGNETSAAYVVRWLRYEPLKACSALIGLSNSVDRLSSRRTSSKRASLRHCGFRNVVESVAPGRRFALVGLQGWFGAIENLRKFGDLIAVLVLDVIPALDVPATHEVGRACATPRG
jgi:hypothetical protein